ncbi:MAG TPA: TAXI family TRAP transporter solute-binding subunit [Rickettsiales bacterium]|nr:TAXI family TRAP transporter solute-binding subunit [Rickettsiales bacterium]
MKLQRIILLALCLMSVSVPGMAASDDAAIGMVTGPKTGTYIVFGRDIAREAAKASVQVNVFDSKGSVDNLKRITSKEKVGLAIVQSDVMGFLSRSKNKDSMEKARKLRLVLPLYNEEVHILANNDIKSIEELNNKRVVVGSEDSGSLITAVNIFSILGITPAKMYQVDPPHGVIAVLNGEVDAMVFVGGKPVKMFKNMEELESIQGANAGKLSHVHFLPITDRRLLKEYNSATITHDDYSYVTQDVPTVSVKALLVTYDYTMKKGDYYREHCRNMGKLVKAIYDNMGDLKSTGHPKWQQVDLDADVGSWKRDECSKGILSGDNESDDSQNTLEKDLLNIIKGQ